MSVDDKNHFQFVPALGYMAATKIIETLLRDPEYKEMIKNVSWNLRPRKYEILRREPSLDHMIEEVKSRVDRTLMPKLLKLIFNNVVPSMVYGATHWLVHAGENTSLRLREQYWRETVYELISHLQWDNFGCVNGQRTLESYVSNRETVDFVIWNQLCSHCMENEIRQFSKTMDWEKCDKVFASIFPVYWYHKIYQKLPKKNMFQPGFFKFFQRNAGREVALDEEKILRTMFKYSVENIRFTTEYGKTVSAMRYFRNYLKDPAEFDELARDVDYFVVPKEVILYLLRTTSGTTLFSPHDLGAVEGVGLGLAYSLKQLPFILFFDDWMSVFETIDVGHFPHFIYEVGQLKWGVDADYYTTLYKPFERVWEICYRRFSSSRDDMGRVLCNICYREEENLFELVFRGLRDHQRIRLIKDLLYYIKQDDIISYSGKFLLHVSEKILKNDEERKLFSQVPKAEPGQSVEERRLRAFAR